MRSYNSLKQGKRGVGGCGVDWTTHKNLRMLKAKLLDYASRAAEDREGRKTCLLMLLQLQVADTLPARPTTGVSHMSLQFHELPRWQNRMHRTMSGGGGGGSAETVVCADFLFAPTHLAVRTFPQSPPPSESPAEELLHHVHTSIRWSQAGRQSRISSGAFPAFLFQCGKEDEEHRRWDRL